MSSSQRYCSCPTVSGTCVRVLQITTTSMSYEDLCLAAQVEAFAHVAKTEGERPEVRTHLCIILPTMTRARPCVSGKTAAQLKQHQCLTCLANTRLHRWHGPRSGPHFSCDNTSRCGSSPPLARQCPGLPSYMAR